MNAVLKRLFSIPVLSLSAVGLTIIMVACSGSSGSNPEDRDAGEEDAGDIDNDNDAGDDEEKDGSKPGEEDDDAGGGKADSGEGNACSKETTRGACFSCCERKVGGGASVLNNAFKECNCKQGGECQADCGDNYCGGNPATADCTSCLKTSEDCEQSANAACANDTKCAAYVTCGAEAECDDLDP